MQIRYVFQQIAELSARILCWEKQRLAYHSPQVMTAPLQTVALLLGEEQTVGILLAELALLWLIFFHSLEQSSKKVSMSSMHAESSAAASPNLLL
jgi:hypothetical protein